MPPYHSPHGRPYHAKPKVIAIAASQAHPIQSLSSALALLGLLYTLSRFLVG